MSLRAVPRPPKDSEFYTIENIENLSSKKDSVTALIRVIGTDQTFSLQVRELMDPAWFSKFSDENKKLIGYYYALALTGNVTELKRFIAVDLFKYPMGLGLASLYIILLIISNLLGGKLTSVGGIEFPSVLYFFPLTFVLGDILTETYGYSVSRKVIQMGFLGNVIALLAMRFVISVPVSPIWDHQDAFERVFSLSTRVSIASLGAYFFGEFSNAMLLSKLKVLYNGRFFKLRVIAASAVADFFDSVFFCFGAFFGILPFASVLKMVVVQFIWVRLF